MCFYDCTEKGHLREIFLTGFSSSKTLQMYVLQDKILGSKYQFVFEV